MTIIIPIILVVVGESSTLAIRLTVETGTRRKTETKQVTESEVK